MVYPLCAVVQSILFLVLCGWSNQLPQYGGVKGGIDQEEFSQQSTFISENLKPDEVEDNYWWNVEGVFSGLEQEHNTLTNIGVDKTNGGQSENVNDSYMANDEEENPCGYESFKCVPVYQCIKEVFNADGVEIIGDHKHPKKPCVISIYPEIPSECCKITHIRESPGQVHPVNQDQKIDVNDNITNIDAETGSIYNYVTSNVGGSPSLIDQGTLDSQTSEIKPDVSLNEETEADLSGTFTEQFEPMGGTSNSGNDQFEEDTQPIYDEVEAEGEIGAYESVDSVNNEPVVGYDKNTAEGFSQTGEAEPFDVAAEDDQNVQLPASFDVGLSDNTVYPDISLEPNPSVNIDGLNPGSSYNDGESIIDPNVSETGPVILMESTIPLQDSNYDNTVSASGTIDAGNDAAINGHGTYIENDLPENSQISASPTISVGNDAAINDQETLVENDLVEIYQILASGTAGNDEAENDQETFIENDLSEISQVSASGNIDAGNDAADADQGTFIENYLPEISQISDSGSIDAGNDAAANDQGTLIENDLPEISQILVVDLGAVGPDNINDQNIETNLDLGVVINSGLDPATQYSDDDEQVIEDNVGIEIEPVEGNIHATLDNEISVDNTYNTNDDLHGDLGATYNGQSESVHTQNQNSQTLQIEAIDYDQNSDVNLYVDTSGAEYVDVNKPAINDEDNTGHISQVEQILPVLSVDSFDIAETSEFNVDSGPILDAPAIVNIDGEIHANENIGQASGAFGNGDIIPIIHADNGQIMQGGNVIPSEGKYGEGSIGETPTSGSRTNDDDQNIEQSIIDVHVPINEYPSESNNGNINPSLEYVDVSQNYGETIILDLDEIVGEQEQEISPDFTIGDMMPLSEGVPVDAGYDGTILTNVDDNTGVINNHDSLSGNSLNREDDNNPSSDNEHLDNALMAFKSEHQYEKPIDTVSIGAIPGIENAAEFNKNTEQKFDEVPLLDSEFTSNGAGFSNQVASSLLTDHGVDIEKSNVGNQDIFEQNDEQATQQVISDSDGLIDPVSILVDVSGIDESGTVDIDQGIYVETEKVTQCGAPYLCVLSYLCTDGSIQAEGVGILNLRSKPSMVEACIYEGDVSVDAVCCLPDHITIPLLPTECPESSQQCVEDGICSSDGFIITDGAGLLDLRIGSATPFQKCLLPSNQEGICCSPEPISVVCPTQSTCVSSDKCTGTALDVNEQFVTYVTDGLWSNCDIYEGDVSIDAVCCIPDDITIPPLPTECPDTSQHCVENGICSNDGFIITDGAGLLDLRIGPVTPFQKCLLPSNQEGICCSHELTSVVCPAQSTCVSPDECTGTAFDANEQFATYTLDGQWSMCDIAIDSQYPSGICCVPPPPTVLKKCPGEKECVLPSKCVGKSFYRSADQTSLDKIPASGECYLNENEDSKGICCEVKKSHIEAAPTCGARNFKLDTRITSSFNQKPNETEFGELPWQAIIFTQNYTFVCGASLVSNTHLITGAHCVHKYTSDAIMIRLGEWQVNTFTENLPYHDSDVAKIIIHPDFTPFNLHSNVALIELVEPIKFQYHINSICLPELDFTTALTNKRYGDKPSCTASGWGKDSFDGDYQAVLKKIELPLVDKDTCQNFLRKTRLSKFFRLHKSFMCAGGEANEDACSGDGGGPLACFDYTTQSYVLTGITSWGIGCGVEDVPGVYADVGAFATWIQDTMNPAIEKQY